MILTRQETKKDLLRNELLDIYQELLNSFETDIETGIEDGTYDEKDNVENRQFIERAKEVLAEFKGHTPEILVYVEGGVLQGISATDSISVDVFDQDNISQGDEHPVGTAKDWDAMIKRREAANEIKSIF